MMFGVAGKVNGFLFVVSLLLTRGGQWSGDWLTRDSCRDSSGVTHRSIHPRKNPSE